MTRETRLARETRRTKVDRVCFHCNKAIPQGAYYDRVTLFPKHEFNGSDRPHTYAFHVRDACPPDQETHA